VLVITEGTQVYRRYWLCHSLDFHKVQLKNWHQPY